MCLPGVIVAAGSAYLFLTATFTTKMGLDLTASQRAEVTKRMLAVIQSRHNHFSTELSPKIKLSCPYERALQEKLTLQTSLLITSCETRLQEICKKIEAEGMLSRLSPSLMKDEITRMREELNDLDENTLTRTKTATGKIDELAKQKQGEINELMDRLEEKRKKEKEKEIHEVLEGKRAKVTVYSEETELGLTELDLSLVPISQINPEGTN